jgi:hypothetical protein
MAHLYTPLSLNILLELLDPLLNSEKIFQNIFCVCICWRSNPELHMLVKFSTIELDLHPLVLMDFQLLYFICLLAYLLVKTCSCCVAQAGLELTVCPSWPETYCPSASASHVLGLQMCTKIS